MKEDRKDIYYITGEIITAVSSSPFLDTSAQEEFGGPPQEDPVDEYCVQQLKGFDLQDEDEKKTL